MSNVVGPWVGSKKDYMLYRSLENERVVASITRIGLAYRTEVFHLDGVSSASNEFFTLLESKAWCNVLLRKAGYQLEEHKEKPLHADVEVDAWECKDAKAYAYKKPDQNILIGKDQEVVINGNVVMIRTKKGE